MNLISASFARNNLSKILDEVVKTGKRFVLIRDSRPSAVIVPYKDLVEKEKEWEMEFERLAARVRPYFWRWLKERKIKRRDLREENLYEVINKAAGRS